MKAYQFSYLRYIHDISTEEFVNIGIVMFIPSEGKFLFRLTDHYTRLSDFYLDFNSSDYRYLLRDLKSKLISAQEFDFVNQASIHEIIPKIVPVESGCFQWSAIMSGAVEKPEQRIEKIFAKVITCHERIRSKTRREDKDISESFFNQLRDKGLLTGVQHNIPIQSRNSRFSYEFKYGWLNGTKQFAEPISLDYKNKKDLENKVSSFIGDMFSLKDSEDFQVTGIVAPPSKEALQQDFQNAVDRLREAPHIRDIILESDIAEFLPKIQQDISRHQFGFYSIETVEEPIKLKERH